MLGNELSFILVDQVRIELTSESVQGILATAVHASPKYKTTLQKPNVIKSTIAFNLKRMVAFDLRRHPM